MCLKILKAFSQNTVRYMETQWILHPHQHEKTWKGLGDIPALLCSWKRCRADLLGRSWDSGRLDGDDGDDDGDDHNDGPIKMPSLESWQHTTYMATEVEETDRTARMGPAPRVQSQAATIQAWHAELVPASGSWRRPRAWSKIRDELSVFGMDLESWVDDSHACECFTIAEAETCCYSTLNQSVSIDLLCLWNCAQTLFFFETKTNMSCMGGCQRLIE